MIREELKKYVTDKEKQLKKVSSIRKLNSGLTKRDFLRKDSDIDYARIIYSSSFRRLQGKMQLLIPGYTNFYRNRLTHSLEVAQISRSIARRLGMKDTLTVQSCSLAHDLGNPPFGHAGEICLNNICVNERYEGNAQTFRILTNIEEKHHKYNGLNLTIRTLLGVVKYPFNNTQNKKKFLYEKDYNLVEKWFNIYKIIKRTIDCEIMDLADEIAYAAHDLEDALKMKLFSIDDILYEFSISKYKNQYYTLKKLVDKARDFGLKAKTYKTSEEFSILFRKELTSSIINLLILDIDLVNNKGKIELGYKRYTNLAKGLKKLTFNAITRLPDVIRYEKLGEKVLKGLYTVLTDNAFNKEQILLPAEYRDENNLERTVLDYIGGMMDEYAIQQYKIYYGNNSLDKLYSKSNLTNN